MSIRIVKNGLLDTLQDAGRHGYAHMGINPGGAMDQVAMQVANMLVGSPRSTAVMEMHFPAAEIWFGETSVIAMAGADISAYVDGKEVPLHRTVAIKKNTTLSFKKRNSGARLYLAVKGGFAIDPWLNSYSTNTEAAAGGYKGRALQKGDVLPLRNSDVQHGSMEDAGAYVFPWQANVSGFYRGDTIRFIPGQAFGLLDEHSKKNLTTQPCTISRESDRMGFRLQAQPLKAAVQKEMISTAVTRGTIQLLPGGQMIILMADHQTTGGYPVIEYVITADFPSLAQLQAGAIFLLQPTGIAEAEAALLRQQMDLQLLQNACTFRLML